MRVSFADGQENGSHRAECPAGLAGHARSERDDDLVRTAVRGERDDRRARVDRAVAAVERHVRDSDRVPGRVLHFDLVACLPVG